MPRVGLVSDPVFLEHDTGSHPECAARLRAIEDYLHKNELWGKTRPVELHAAHREDILRAHRESLYEDISHLVQQGGGYLDSDTVVSEGSGKAALMASGGMMTAVREIMGGSLDRVLALVRPPGHHATRTRSMGFCLFNHIAIAVHFLLNHYEVERIGIVDFDVHHGNGTQDIFYEDPRVFFFSIHQYPLYPMSGLVEERGRGQGKGTTLNVPLAPGTPREHYWEAYEKALDEVFRFNPQFIFISAGFDAHLLDPLAQLCLESEDFHRLTHSICQRAEAQSVKGMVSALEGGYHFQSLAESVSAHLQALLE